MARLIVITPSGAGPTFELSEAWITIGRGNTNALQIVEATVSERHCEVKLSGTELLVRDLCSTNGVVIGSERTPEGIVKIGQTFWLGNTGICLESSPLPPPAAPAAAPAAPLADPPVFSLRQRSLKPASVSPEKISQVTSRPEVASPAKPAPLEAESDTVVFSLRQRPALPTSGKPTPDKSRPKTAAKPASPVAQPESDATVFSLRHRPAMYSQAPAENTPSHVPHPVPGAELARRDSNRSVFSLRQRPAGLPATPPAANCLPATPVAPPAAAPPPPPLEISPKQFQVLFVDDSLAFLDSFAAICGELSGGKWQVHTRTTAEQALTFLQAQPMDLVVLDIGMPTVDGIQLLGIIHRQHPGLKIAMLTGLFNEGNRATCLAAGAELFLEKPFSAEGIKLVFNLLNLLLIRNQQKGFSGTLQEVSLPDVIQLECVSRKSVILEVRNTSISGQIYIESGAIIHATTGTVSGEKAFQELLLLEGGQFQLQPFLSPPEHTIAGAWEVLLMEAARVQDETRFAFAK